MSNDVVCGLPATEGQLSINKTPSNMNQSARIADSITFGLFDTRYNPVGDRLVKGFRIQLSAGA